MAPAAHRPRITIDRFVLSREQWTFQVADSAWAFAKDEQERYYLARRWRQDHGLPERVFYRVPVELKPTAADFRSIVLVNLLAKHIRQTQAAGHTEYTVTEMLPDLDQLWLTDREGRRYSSELRIIAYDNMTEDHCRSCLTVARRQRSSHLPHCVPDLPSVAGVRAGPCAMLKVRVCGRACQAPGQEPHLEGVGCLE